MCQTSDLDKDGQTAEVSTGLVELSQMSLFDPEELLLKITHADNNFNIRNDQVLNALTRDIEVMKQEEIHLFLDALEQYQHLLQEEIASRMHGTFIWIRLIDLSRVSNYRKCCSMEKILVNSNLFKYFFLRSYFETQRTVPSILKQFTCVLSQLGPHNQGHFSLKVHLLVKKYLELRQWHINPLISAIWNGQEDLQSFLHQILYRAIYLKSKVYFNRLSNNVEIKVKICDGIRKITTIIICEIFRIALRLSSGE